MISTSSSREKSTVGSASSTGLTSVEAVPGSLSPVPVRTATIVAPASMRPSAASLRTPATEAALCETLRELRGEITILAISHQSALVDAADRVYRLEKGAAELEVDRIEAKGAESFDA